MRELLALLIAFFWRPTVTHVVIGLVLMGGGALLWMAGLRGPHWQGALIASFWFLSRELAQSMRPSAPFTFRLAARSIRDAGWPAGATIAIAFLIDIIARGSPLPDRLLL